MWSLLQFELFKTFKKPRTYIAFAAIAAIVFLIQLALLINGKEYVQFMLSSIDDTLILPYEKITNGYWICFAILNLLLIHVPILVALVSGDIIAGEANAGTLRLLLTKPVSRTKLMLIKFLACIVYTLLLLIWMAFLSLFISVLLFGTNDLVVAKEFELVQIQKADVLWRYFAAFGFAAVALIVVAALSFLLSTISENSIGPIVATVSIIIVLTILSEMRIPIYDNTVKPYLFTTHMLGWKGFFYIGSNADGQTIKGSVSNLPAIMKSLAILFCYIIFFVGTAIFIFNKKRCFKLMHSNINSYEKIPLLLFLFSFISSFAFTQDSQLLLQKIKDKLNRVNNYEADAVMTTDVSFLKVPKANVKVYFKKPDKLKIKNEKGISFVPKGAVSINLSNIISGNNFTVLDAGNATIENKPVKILKLLPLDESNNIILSTIYINEKNGVIVKAQTTTKDNGTYSLDLKYGRFTEYGLPDDVIFTFNTKDYKMPKGVTFDYDDASSQKSATAKSATNKGKIEISYSAYKINKGVSDEVFK